MHKTLIATLTVLTLATMIAAAPVAATSTPDFTIIINGQTQVYDDPDHAPQLVDGHIMVPAEVYALKIGPDPVNIWYSLRAIATDMGATVAWDPVSRTATITSPGGGGAQ